MMPGGPIKPGAQALPVRLIPMWINLTRLTKLVD